MPGIMEGRDGRKREGGGGYVCARNQKKKPQKKQWREKGGEARETEQ